jgi:hypothetical protein
MRWNFPYPLAATLLATASPAFAAGGESNDAGGGALLFLLIPALVFGVWIRLRMLRLGRRLLAGALGLDANVKVEGMPTGRSAKFARIDREIDNEDVSSVDDSIAAMLAERNAPPRVARAAPPAAPRSGFGRRGA